MKTARLTPLRLADCKQGRTLDLGCGKSPQNPFELQEVYGIDIQADTKNQKYCAKVDLAIEGLPFPNEHFDAITACDFIEHVPRVIYNPRRRNSFVELMNEIHRCLKPNGIFMSVTSAFPNTQAFQDPTHVNIITEETFPKYFCTP